MSLIRTATFFTNDTRLPGDSLAPNYTSRIVDVSGADTLVAIIEPGFVLGANPTLDALVQATRDLETWTTIGSMAQVTTGSLSERKQFEDLRGWRFIRAMVIVSGSGNVDFTISLTGKLYLVASSPMAAGLAAGLPQQPGGALGSPVAATGLPQQLGGALGSPAAIGARGYEPPAVLDDDLGGDDEAAYFPPPHLSPGVAGSAPLGAPPAIDPDLWMPENEVFAPSPASASRAGEYHGPVMPSPPPPAAYPYFGPGGEVPANYRTPFDPVPSVDLRLKPINVVLREYAYKLGVDNMARDRYFKKNIIPLYGTMPLRMGLGPEDFDTTDEDALAAFNELMAAGVNPFQDAPHDIASDDVAEYLVQKEKAEALGIDVAAETAGYYEEAHQEFLAERLGPDGPGPAGGGALGGPLARQAAELDWAEHMGWAL